MGQNIPKKQKMAGIIPIILLPVLLLLSFFVGKYSIDFSNIFNADTLDYSVFWKLRAARSMMALASGIALGVAGNVLQTVFRNPLASPDVIGVASGASAGAALALVFGGFGLFLVPVSALCGGLLAVLLVLLLGKLTRRGDTVTLLLAGIVINAIFQAALMIIKLCADSEQTLAGIEFWLMGSFSDTTLSTLWPVLVPMLIGLAALFIMHRPLRLLLLPDDEAAMLGVNVKRTRGLALVFATLVTAAVISENGIISFVGLIAPHIARRLVRSDRSGGMLLSGIIGADILLAADTAVRVIGTSELPISVATSVIGAPVLFALVCRREQGMVQLEVDEISGTVISTQKSVAGGENTKVAGAEETGAENGNVKPAGTPEKTQEIAVKPAGVRTIKLSAGYGKKNIIRDISLEIPAGQLCAVIGRNGSGKTTLIKAMMGLIGSTGDLKISSDIGYMAALSDVALPISVFEMVMLGWYRELGTLKRAGEREKKAAAELIEQFGLKEYENRDYRTLSTGQKQLVCLARTLVRKPELLILDEPDSALDFDRKYFLMEYLKAYAATGKTVIICSHDVNLMLKYVDRIFMMQNGLLSGECRIPDGEITESGQPGKTEAGLTDLQTLLSKGYGDIEIISHAGKLIMTGRVK